MDNFRTHALPNFSRKQTIMFFFLSRMKIQRYQRSKKYSYEQCRIYTPFSFVLAIFQLYAEPIVYYTTYNLKSFSALKAKGCVLQPIFQHICDQQHVFPENNCTTSHGRYASRTCRSVSGQYPGDPSQVFVLHLMRIMINDFSLLFAFVTAFLLFSLSLSLSSNGFSSSNMIPLRSYDDTT